MQHYIAIKDNKVSIVKFKLSRGIAPSLPGYRFIGPYETNKKAEGDIPIGMEYKGKVIGLELSK